MSVKNLHFVYLRQLSVNPGIISPSGSHLLQQLGCK